MSSATVEASHRPVGGLSPDGEATSPHEATLQAALNRATEQLARERRRREKLKTQVARQQAQLQEMQQQQDDAEETPSAAAAAAAAAAESLRAANSRLSEEAAQSRERTELMRRRLAEEAARRDEELRQLQARHAEDDEAAKDALTKVAVSLEAARMENAGLRRALEREQREAASQQAEAERLRTGLTEAAAAVEAAAEVEELQDQQQDRTAGLRDQRLRELRDANVRLQEKLASAEARLASLRSDFRDAADEAEQRGELAVGLRERLAASEALRAAEADKDRPARQSEAQLAAICHRLERAEADGRSRQAALVKSPTPPQANEPAVLAADGADGAEAASSSQLPSKEEEDENKDKEATLNRKLEGDEVDEGAGEAKLAGALKMAREELAELRARLRTERDSNSGLRAEVAALRSRSSDGGGSARSADAWRESRQPAGGAGCNHRLRPDWKSASIGSGLWRVSCCTDNLDDLRRSCLSLATERDRLSGDCRHYRRLYEEERRLRRRLTEELRRLNCSDDRARALTMMMEADSSAERGPLHGASVGHPGRLEISAYATYLRQKYTVA